jgi:hypothetical protein
MGKQMEAEAMAAQQKSTLPEAVQLDAVSSLITEVYLAFWNA